jgi:hypothetical protein
MLATGISIGQRFAALSQRFVFSARNKTTLFFSQTNTKTKPRKTYDYTKH